MMNDVFHLSHPLVMSMYLVDTYSPDNETVSQDSLSVSETNHRLTINRLTTARVLLVEQARLCVVVDGQSVERS